MTKKAMTSRRTMASWADAKKNQMPDFFLLKRFSPESDVKAIWRNFYHDVSRNAILD
jgi:hypothetical protein